MADIVKDRVPGAKIDFEPNQDLQNILDRLLLPLDDSYAHKEWNWKPSFVRTRIVTNDVSPARILFALPNIYNATPGQEINQAVDIT